VAFLELVSSQSVKTYFVVVSGAGLEIFYLASFLLPRSLSDTRKFAAVCHLAEADSADAELLVNRVWATAT
jgi:hypothetical protein